MNKLTFSDYAWFLVGAGALFSFYPAVNEIIHDLGATYFWYSLYLAYLIAITTFVIRFKRGFRIHGKQGAVSCLILVAGSIGYPWLLLVLSPNVWHDNSTLAFLITGLSFLSVAASGYSKLKNEPENIDSENVESAVNS